MNGTIEVGESPDSDQIDFRTALVTALRDNTDEELRQDIDQLAIDQIPAFQKLSEKKQEHTRSALRHLDTSQLPDDDERFIARAATVLHDTDPLLAAQEIVVMQQHGEITGKEAVRIFRHIWWHDFAGKYVEHIYDNPIDFHKLFPTKNDRDIHIAIYRADFKAHPELQYNNEAAEQGIQFLENLPIPKELDLYPPSPYEPEIYEGKRVPKDDEVFVHDIRGDARVLVVFENMIANGANLTSANLISLSERCRHEVGVISTMNALGHTINTVVATADAYEPYPGNSGVSFLVPGRNLQKISGNVIDPIYGESDANVAGIINQFDIDNNPVGAFVDPDFYYISLNYKTAKSKLPLIRLMCNHSYSGGNEHFTDNVVLYNTQEERVELVKQLAAGTLNVVEWNHARLSESFAEKLELYNTSFTVMHRGKVLDLSELSNIVAKDVVYGDIDLNALDKIEEELNDLNPYYPEFVKEQRAKLSQTKKMFNNRISVMRESLAKNPRGIYDTERKLFYFMNDGVLSVYPSETDPTLSFKETGMGRMMGEREWQVVQSGKEFEISDGYM